MKTMLQENVGLTLLSLQDVPNLIKLTFNRDSSRKLNNLTPMIKTLLKL